VIQNIQTMRVLFTFMVITAHLENAYAVIGLDKLILMFARVSVDGFIVVSAFLIPFTQALRPKLPLAFLGRRLARLVPLYWAVTLFVAAIALALPHIFAHTVVTPETLFKSLFFIPYQKSWGQIEPIVYVGWTMNLFVAYILLHALSLKLAGKYAWVMTTLVLLALVAFGFAFKPQEAFVKFFTGPRLLSFVAGLLLCTWWLHARHSRLFEAPQKWLKPTLYAMALIGFLLCTLRDSILPLTVSRYYGPLFACMLIAAAIMLDRIGAVHRSKLRDRLAEASFAIYLTHYLVTEAVIRIVPRLNLTDAVTVVPVILASYVVIAVIGLFVTRVIEAPLETAVRYAWRTMTTRIATPGPRPAP